MAPYDDERGWACAAAQALTWADQTTGPDGRVVTVTERLAEVQERHGPDSPLVRCRGERGPSILVDAATTVQRMAHQREVHQREVRQREVRPVAAERTGGELAS